MVNSLVVAYAGPAMSVSAVRLAMFSFLVLGAGCANRMEGLATRRAAADFGCEQPSVAVDPQNVGGMSGHYRASGCGHEDDYYVRCGLLGFCSVMSSTDQQQQAAQPMPVSSASSASSDAPLPAGSPPPTSASDSPPASAAPAGPARVSVSLRNTAGCPDTVKLFFGDKPKFGSGRYSSIGKNTVQSHSGTEGEQIWIVDDGQNGLASVTLSPGVRTIEVASSCTAFQTR
jgi:hypothetical protein